MSSILTNNSAMVALQTLKSINSNLGKIQSEISTGKTVETAKDNAAVWAISKVMQSDVSGFAAISDSLSLGEATVGVAMNGAGAITDLLTEVKGKVVNAQESNVDRDKIQTDIEALTSQIKSIVGAAQFNGLNLLNGSDTAAVDVLSSLDRDANGNVSTGQISVDRTNLNASAVLASETAVAGGANGGTAATTITAAATATTVAMTFIEGDGVATVATTGDMTGVAFSLTLSGSGTSYADAEFTTGTATTSSEITYVAQDGDTDLEIGLGLKAAFDTYASANNISSDVLSVAATATGISVTTGAGETGAISASINANKPADGTAHKASGELQALDGINVTTLDGANAALTEIEGLIQTSIDTAANLGSSARQIETQSDFVGKLSDLLTSGIGTLVDADMEASSAKLQALQTQQQLGVQALSIANQAPQTILSLFR